MRVDRSHSEDWRFIDERVNRVVDEVRGDPYTLPVVITANSVTCDCGPCVFAWPAS
jgi:hypothetical protein